MSNWEPVPGAPHMALYSKEKTLEYFKMAEQKAADDVVTLLQCPIEQAKGTCEPFDDPRSHDFQGWVEFDEGRGGTTVCTRCGISAFSHAMRYAP